MSLSEAPLQSGYPDEFSDAMANMTASILQEQLAPILETLREHARLLDLHAALLNHSTVMNRYNVGKLDDIRDFQNNINFKLQFYVRPEDRWYPNYRNPEVPTPIAISNAASRLLAEDSIPSDEPTQSTDSSPSSSSVTTAPELPDRPSTPDTEPADSRPTTPTQQLGDGFSVVPGPSRRLQRERPFSVAPDPMWNSTREINPYQHLAAPAPPPPYVSPPTYAEVVPEERNDAAEHIDMEMSTIQAPTLAVLHASALSPIFPPPTVIEEEEVEASLSADATSTSTSSTGDSLDNPLPSPVSSPSGAATANLSNGTDDASSRPSSPITSTSPADNLTASEVEAVHDDPALGPSSQLSEKARGKKRMREEDYASDEEDEALERLLGEGGSGHNPSTSSRDGQPDRKRVKTDTRINTDRLEVDEDILMLARMGLVEELTPIQRRRQNEKLKTIQKLYRSGRDSY